MTEVLIITSSGWNEFSKWRKGGHGKVSEDAYKIASGDNEIHVVNGKPNNNSMTATEKADCVQNWLEKRSEAGSFSNSMS